ncbi:MAG: FkbM family methyltransferase [Scytonema sp. PMC 1069.18]|nr:FkbM family methyltransferase [Scytonema sp. PMC 1069.18]MEC4886096.1 FkbM family methyltransferase [Scytonema sp. PMC 1070.18]
MSLQTTHTPNRFQKTLIDSLGFLFRRVISRGRGLLLKLVFPNGSNFDYNFTILNKGKLYSGNLKFGIDHHIFFFQFFEPQNIRILQSISTYLYEQKIPVNFLDIGANVGSHSHFLLDFADSIHSFEPHPEIFESLAAKWKAHQNPSFHIYHFGLGDKDCKLEYYAPTSDNTGTGSFIKGSDNNSEVSISLPIRRGDDVVAEIGVSPVSLIKVDVEGFEPFVLQGLAQTLKRDRPIMMMEMSAVTRKMMNEENLSLSSLLYENVAIFEIQATNLRGKFRLERKDSNTLSKENKFLQDLLIVPAEHVYSLIPKLDSRENYKIEAPRQVRAVLS